MPCYFFRFGLIVTGEGERAHLHKLFRPLLATGICHFEVIGKIGQRNPIVSEKKKIQMTGRGKEIPDKDAEEIGILARKWLSKDCCHYIILIDDLERDRNDQIGRMFERYRSALDVMLTEKQRSRASVHFLTNMLEAYYFAHAKAINSHLDPQEPLTDYPGDVESISNPKSELQYLFRGYDEIRDAGGILDHLDAGYVLARPNTCASLRSLFAWCEGVNETSSSLFFERSLP